MTVTTQTKKTDFIRQDLHQQVTDTIIEQLEKGVVPWQQPWKGNNSLLNGLPFNTSTGKKYRGVNIVLLWADNLRKNHQTNEWGTFNHWNKAKEYIRKGESGTDIIKYETLEREVNGETEKYSYLKKYRVYNRSQLQSWKPVEFETSEHMPASVAIERSVVLDEFVRNTRALIESHDGGACYNFVFDKIFMPYAEKFMDTKTLTSVEGFYSTLLHELTHWSGASHRLNRTKGKRFGDQEYAYEELVAELGAAFLCAEFDISTLKTGDHAAYIDNWIKVLKDNKQMLVSAAAEASVAFDYLYNLQP